MNYIEAFKEARAGKIVRQMPSMCKAKVDVTGTFVWASCGNQVNQHVGTICAEWELATEPPLPPKRYNFTEAYAMMKKGKWMMPCCKLNGDRYQYRFEAGVLVRKGSFCGQSMPGDLMLLEWEEGQP